MEVIRIAIESLKRHKLRSFLTLLGVIIGVATVISVVSVISGLNNYIAEKVFSLNPDVFVVTKFGIITSREEFLEALRRRNIDDRDIHAVKTLCDRCETVGVGIQQNMTVKSAKRRLNNVEVYGGTSNMAELNNLELAGGRFFTQTEDHHSAPVAIIGADVRDELFGRLDPIGRTVWVAGSPMKVIGLIEKQGNVLGESQDRRLYMSIEAFRRQFGYRRSLNIFIKARGGVPGVNAAQDQVRTILRNRRHTPFKAKDPFGLVSAESLQQVWKRITATAFAVMIFISSISLIVGGIVIMNIMLVSVVERTREIGIRRAIGARQRDIKRQFLMEAILLALIGGIAGVLLGAGISKGISAVFPLPTLIRPSLIATGLGIAVFTGVIAGFFPAKRAASLPPIEALRWE